MRAAQAVDSRMSFQREAFRYVEWATAVYYLITVPCVAN